MAKLGRNRYGKAGIRLVKVLRNGARHSVRDVTVAVALEGDFDAAHVAGDNARILPTDTMKNTVYALAKVHFTESIEEFALELADYFMANAPVHAVRVKLQEHVWARLLVGGTEHEHSFRGGGSEVRTTRVRRDRHGVSVRSGVRALNLLKTTRSGFTGYIRDAYTTLPETTDRIFATALNAEWSYDSTTVEFDTVWQTAMRAITETFAEHDSRSVQHTLYAMGEKVLAQCAAVQRIRFALPNKHHLLFDLGRFGIENRNEVFIATTEPYGLIEADVTR
ncbi:MAG TPA: urate oxidase [Longimicrobiales bacterium]